MASLRKQKIEEQPGNYNGVKIVSSVHLVLYTYRAQHLRQTDTVHLRGYAVSAHLPPTFLPLFHQKANQDGNAATDGCQNLAEAKQGGPAIGIFFFFSRSPKCNKPLIRSP
jgi:hypothetical protein